MLISSYFNVNLLICHFTAVLGRLPGTTVYRNIQQYPEAYTYNGIVIVRIDAPIYFANTSYIKDRCCFLPLGLIVWRTCPHNPIETNYLPFYLLVFPSQQKNDKMVFLFAGYVIMKLKWIDLLVVDRTLKESIL